MERIRSTCEDTPAQTSNNRSLCARLQRIVKRLFNREVLLYGIFGVLTTLLNLGLFRLLLFFQLDYRWANIITLIVVKLASYVVNKLFVFNSHARSFLELCKEFLRYLVTRGFTALIDYFGLIMLVELFDIAEMPGKCIVTIMVVILNYILGKYIVFTKRTDDGKHEAEG